MPQLVVGERENAGPTDAIFAQAQARQFLLCIGKFLFALLGLLGLLGPADNGHRIPELLSDAMNWNSVVNGKTTAK